MQSPQANQPPRRLTVEFDHQAERVRGRVVIEGEPRRFDGWMQLTALLEEERSRDAQPGEQATENRNAKEPDVAAED